MINNHKCLDHTVALTFLVDSLQQTCQTDKVATRQVFGSSAGPGCQVSRALTESSAVVPHARLLIKHTQVEYLESL